MSADVLSERSTMNPMHSSRISDKQLFRYAYDRCRGQKLRCERQRPNHGSDTCNRCMRAGAKCITSPPVRMGRPRQKTSIQVPSKPVSSRATRTATPQDFEPGFDLDMDLTWTLTLIVSPIQVLSSSTMCLFPSNEGALRRCQ